MKNIDIGGKIPPQDIETEKLILGTILSMGSEIYDISAKILHPNVFYHDGHRLIYKAMEMLSIENNPIDLISVIMKLVENGQIESVGGKFYVTQLTNFCSYDQSTILYSSKKLFERYLKREMIRYSIEAISECYNENSDPFEIIEKSEKKSSELLSGLQTSQTKHAYDVALSESKRIREMVNKNVPTGIPYNLKELNRFTGGGQKGDLILLAARPAMGKSSEGLSILLNSAKQGIPGAIFSYEMSNEQLMLRTFAELTGISVGKIKALELESYHLDLLDHATREISRYPLYLLDKPVTGIAGIRAEARRLKKEKGIQWLVIDYVGLAFKSTGNKIEDIGELSKGLKLLAKELDIPIIALSQLNRDVEKRPDKRPQLSDLKDSSQLEADADVVLLLYRPEEYGIKTIEIDGIDQDSTGKAIFIIAKNRNGKCTDVVCQFVGSTTSFYDLDYVKPNSLDSIGVTSSIKPNGDF